MEGKLKPAPKRERVSVFDLLVNSNKSEYTSNDPQLRAKMERASDVMFKGPNPLVIVLGLEDWTQEDKMDKRNVISAELEVGGLESGQKSRLHQHIHIEVKHKGYLRLNQPKLKAAYERIYGGKIAVFSIKGSSNHTEEMKIYVGKQGGSTKVSWKPTGSFV